MESRLGFVLVKIEPVASGCVAHAVARPGEDVGFAFETFHALADIRQRLNALPVSGMTREQGYDATCLCLGSFGADNEVVVTECQFVDLYGLGAPQA